MNKLTSPRTIRDIMDRYGFKFSKRYGQNFIIDEHVLDKIVEGAHITKEDAVLEIGPGIGVMTNTLCEAAGQVVSVEIDKTLMPVLSETVGHHENLHIIEGDILKIDIKDLFERHFKTKRPKLVANLPYYVTTPIIMKFLEEHIPVTDLVIMIQKEVADRILASPSTSDYGALSVAVQYFTEPSIVTRVSRGSFMPAPNVDSTVLRLKVRDKPPVKLADEAVFFMTVKDGFGKRRKTLLNALTGGFLGLTRDQANEALACSGISPQLRAETLGIEEFATLSNCIVDVIGALK